MEYLDIANSLSKNKAVFLALLDGTSKAEYLWKPAPAKWCLLEVLCHLCDEEQEDFRTRVHHVLENPNSPPPPIDPVGWVTSRAYIQQNFEDKLNEFMKARESSVEWLKLLKSPKWDNAYQHPELGTRTAKMFLANWLAHDYHHIRQINRLKYEFLKAHEGADLSYAGDW